MFEKYLNFVRGVSATWYGKLGVILTTSSFATLVLLELARLAGIVTNTYVGLVTYLLFPTLFVIGLVLIPLGWFKLKRLTGKSTRELLLGRFEAAATGEGFFGSRLFRTIVIFSLINIIFLGGISSQMLSFMDEPVFCGTACHSVMNPEWTTYQDSPHARVRCVDCHVGEGVDALLDSKLNGIWQMVSVTFDLLERPIPTPVRQLRPARETCENCHWPEKFYGSRLKTIVSYQPDSASTPLFTTLALKVDAGRGGEKAGIHWHIGAETEVRYVSIDDEREQIVWTEVRRPDGSYHRYTNKELAEAGYGDVKARVMDCVDCHNRATHIYEDADRALDERIRRGLLTRTLPYLKREALHAISNDYGDSMAVMQGIENQLNGFYRSNYPDLALSNMDAIDSVIAVLQGVHLRNIHPEMNITWGSYPSHIGHVGDGGCFRCHNPDLVDEEGGEVEYDCTLCHSILAYDEDEPFEYVLPLDTADIEAPVHRYLRQEFLLSYRH